ncbi:MAG TPA: cell wall hydrolase [Rhizomicrobium sp.]|nr:cell wall hydrolase [Rhizomicrobium sp.]
MTPKKKDALARSDRALIAAMAIIIATASAALGASMSYRPSADKKASAPIVVVAEDASPAIPKDSPISRLVAEHRCLSEVMYYEARGEGAGGQKAIAEVVFHRMRNGNYGNSICAVVFEGAGRPSCQFSFACNGDMRLAKEPQAWRNAEFLAARILTGEVRLANSTGGATNFHAISVEPEWAPTLKRTTQIGNHIFYRGGPGVAVTPAISGAEVTPAVATNDSL